MFCYSAYCSADNKEERKRSGTGKPGFEFVKALKLNTLKPLIVL
jgi:hypothetical protein